MRLSGMPLQAIVSPALAVGALVSVVVLWLLGGPAAGAEQALRSRQKDLVDRFLASLSGPDRTIALEGARISFARYEGGVFHDVEIDRREKDDGTFLQKLLGDEVVLQRSGDELEIRSPLLWVVGEVPTEAGVRTGVRRGPGAVSVGRVEEVAGGTAFRDLIGGGKFELRPKDMDVSDLAYLVQRGEIGTVSAKRTRIEIHARLATGTLPLLFALLAAAGALQVRPGGRRLLGFLLAMAPVLLVHFPLALFGRSFAEAGRVPAAVGLWGPSVLAAAVGLALLWRVSAR
jgi:lipopolysaccharide export LptBFGC system permease protein LptF